MDMGGPGEGKGEGGQILHFPDGRTGHRRVARRVPARLARRRRAAVARGRAAGGLDRCVRRGDRHARDRRRDRHGSRCAAEPAHRDPGRRLDRARRAALGTARRPARGRARRHAIAVAGQAARRAARAHVAGAAAGVTADGSFDLVAADIGHHGSRTSSSAVFLNAVRPTAANLPGRLSQPLRPSRARSARPIPRARRPDRRQPGLRGAGLARRGRPKAAANASMRAATGITGPIPERS